MKTWIIIMFLSIGSFCFGQQVISQGKIYEVKNKLIFQDGVDVTETLMLKEKEDIFKLLKHQKKELKQAEKARKKLEKAAKEAKKANKKSSDALKKKKKAEAKFLKASKKLEKQEAKFKKLKLKGKLSPNEEAKWFKKLEGYRKDVQKAKNKLYKN